MPPGGFRQVERDIRSLQPHRPVRAAGDIALRRGQDKSSPAAPVVKDTALHARRRPADDLLREGALLKPRPPGQVAHAEQRLEGDGEMDPDPAIGSVEDGSPLQVVLGDAEDPLDLPERAMVPEHVACRHVTQVGHHPMKPVPAGLPSDTGLVHNKFGFALDTQETVEPAVPDPSPERFWNCLSATSPDPTHR